MMNRPQANAATTLTRSASEGERSLDFLRNGALWSFRPRLRLLKLRSFGIA